MRFGGGWGAGDGAAIGLHKSRPADPFQHLAPVQMCRTVIWIEENRAVQVRQRRADLIQMDQRQTQIMFQVGVVWHQPSRRPQERRRFGQAPRLP